MQFVGNKLACVCQSYGTCIIASKICFISRCIVDGEELFSGFKYLVSLYFDCTSCE
jgi:hypothetical protein